MPVGSFTDATKDFIRAQDWVQVAMKVIGTQALEQAWKTWMKTLAIVQ